MPAVSCLHSYVSTNDFHFWAMIWQRWLWKRALVLLMLWFPISIAADDWDDHFHEWVALEEIAEEDAEELYLQLSELAEEPFNINTATQEELESLPFLSEREVEEICAYIYLHGSMKSWGELVAIEALDFTKRQLLKHFVYIGEVEQPLPKLKDFLNGGKHKLIATVQVPCYQRKGDKKGYAGYPYKHWFHYSYKYRKHLKMGLVGAQDAGEPWGTGCNKMGYDNYSPYLQLSEMGKLEQLVLGRYRANFGLGLISGSSFSLGKSGMLTSLGRTTQGLRAFSSRSTSDYLQGIGITMKMSNKLKITAFASYRWLDCTLNKDGTVATIISSTYHRTKTEIEKKNNTEEATYGGSVAFSDRGWHLSLNMMNTHLNRPLHPYYSGSLYRKYYPSGSSFTNTSLAYAYHHPSFSLNGETAIDKKGALATINQLTLSKINNIDILFVQRYYQYKYEALRAHSFGNNSKVQNETGVCLGVNWQLRPQIKLMAYSDYSYHPWARYRVSQASHNWENQLTATLQKKSWQIGMRYRLKMSEKDNTSHSALYQLWEQRARLSVSYTPSVQLTLTTEGDWCYVANADADKGVAINQKVVWQKGRIKLKFSGTYFCTDSYDSRMYVGEPTLNSCFSYPMLEGRGVRCAVMAHYDVGSMMYLAAKIGMTSYFDRDVISSGLQQINQSSKTDIEVQGCIKF